MPLYEWKCPVCRHKQEQIVSNWFAATNAEFLCERCKSVMERERFSKGTGPDGNAVFFRGPGFYETDYKDKK